MQLSHAGKSRDAGTRIATSRFPPGRTPARARTRKSIAATSSAASSGWRCCSAASSAACGARSRSSARRRTPRAHVRADDKALLGVAEPAPVPSHQRPVLAQPAPELRLRRAAADALHVQLAGDEAAGHGGPAGTVGSRGCRSGGGGRRGRGHDDDQGGDESDGFDAHRALATTVLVSNAPTVTAGSGRAGVISRGPRERRPAPAGVPGGPAACVAGGAPAARTATRRRRLRRTARSARSRSRRTPTCRTRCASPAGRAPCPGGG